MLFFTLVTITSAIKVFSQEIEIGFQDYIKSEALNENIDYKFHVYPDEGHVPYPSLYHGLKFIYESKD